MANKQGQIRLSSYYEWISMAERVALESEIIRKCLSRSELQCSFVEYCGYKVIYRRYASLFLIVGTSTNKCVLSDATNSNTHNSNSNSNNSNSNNSEAKADENTVYELGLLEFFHTLVETMDKWAGSIHLDIMYQLEHLHFLVDETVMNGCIVETNKSNILRSIDLIERESKKDEGMLGGR